LKEVAIHLVIINLGQIPVLLTTQTGPAVQKEAAITVHLKQEVLTAGNHKTIQNQVIRFHRLTLAPELQHTEAVVQETATGLLQQALHQEAIQAKANPAQAVTQAHQAGAATLEEALAAVVLAEAVLVEVAQEEATAVDQALRAAEDRKNNLIENLISRI